MEDEGPSGHPRSLEFLNIYLGGSLQPGPGVPSRGACGPPGSPVACGPPDPPGACGSPSPPGTCGLPDPPGACSPPGACGSPGPPGACGLPDPLGACSPPGACGTEPPPLESCVSPRSPRHAPTVGSPSISTQAVFWAGILQAQMCVLDLEEELEKTEGLHAELRGCLPAAPTDLSTFSSLAGSTASGLHPQPPPMGEDSEEDSSGPGDESPGWQRAGTPGSSPEWGAEQEALFCDNPLFLDSAGSGTSTPRQHASWGLPGPCAGAGAGPESPQSRGSEPDASGHSAPPSPVPTYRPHPPSWATADVGACAPAAPPSQACSEVSPGDVLGPAASAALCVDNALTRESGLVASKPDPAAIPLQPVDSGECPRPSWQVLPRPEGGHTEESPLCSPGSGEPDAGRRPKLATSTQVPGPLGSPASSPERSLQPRHHCSGRIFPRGARDALPPLLLETDEKEVPSLGQGMMCESTTARPGAPMASAEGLPENPMPQAQCPEEGQRPQAGDKLANGVRTDKVAWNLASRLYHLQGFRKSEVAAYLQKNNDASRAVAQEYLSFFQFGGQSLDRALRSFLQALELSGETQERERVLFQFSQRFHHCNPGAFSSADSVHTLTCAVMLLNTDLHGQNIGKRMSCQEFIANLNGLRDGGNFPKELLKALYWSIRSEKLDWAVDEDDASRPEAMLSPPAGKMSNPLLQLAQDPTVPTYKQGPLARKMHHDVDGKKTPWGKRGWKTFHTLLRGMVLYFLKGEEPCPEGESLEGQMVGEPVGVHHSLATPAAHYTKKPHVFQLRTADWRLYLFQAPTAREMRSWIARINLAAATHSAPPFPAAVGSQRRFVRPVLPVGPAQSSLEQQQRAHESCLDAASDDLLDLQRSLPERRGRGRELEEDRLRKEHLEHEKTRYETYTRLLAARLHCPSDDLDLWEEQLGQEAGGARGPRPSLEKSHSSPSLHQDEAPSTVKVKRNISERRTYRKIIPKRSRNQL